jgi:hypothetical protein
MLAQRRSIRPISERLKYHNFHIAPFKFMTPLMKHLKEILQNEEAFKLANPIAKKIVEETQTKLKHESRTTN